ncbi:MAG TPA: HypC/HybG/HupF family hydrogenase formation chaperone [Acidimicrobiales bacterium]|jgi:hydrogenase expression/formation protein HypC|nr:HypC/HybG/HupF family hydrogenase formation chaperone [Acidimicrobiales bacterium]
MCLGIPGQIVDLADVAEHKAIVDVNGVRRAIHIGLLVDSEAHGLEVGDWVLVHVGFAMSKMDEEEAAETLAFIREMGESFNDEMAQLRQSPVL